MKGFCCAIILGLTLSAGAAPAISRAQLESAARKALASKKYDQVVSLLNPNTDEITDRAFLVLATAYQELADFQNLTRVLTLLSEKRPKDYHIAFMLGDAQLKQAKAARDLTDRTRFENEAIASFRNVIRINRSYYPAHQALVNYFQDAGLNHEAREQLGDMLKNFGDRGEIHADLCRLYSVDGFLQQAVIHCRRAMMITPKFPESYVYLAQTYFDKKELNLAEKTLIGAARKFPNSEFVQYGAGQFFLKKNNFPVAAKYLKRAVEAEDKSSRSQLALAKALFESGDVKTSLTHFKQACKLTPLAKSDFLAAASRLRLKGDREIAGEFSMAASDCKSDHPAN